jgi:hypothetical protein
MLALLWMGDSADLSNRQTEGERVIWKLHNQGADMKTEEQRLKYNAYMREWKRKKFGIKEGANPGRPASTPEVLWGKVDKHGPDECWPWKGTIHEDGYGRTWINDRGYYAHRVIFNLANPGQIELASPTNRKAKGFLMHLCDNRVCCNPAHLQVATIKENNKDCQEKGRRNLPKGEDHFRSVFTNDEIEKILKMRQSGSTATKIAIAMNKNRSTIKSLLYRNRKAV